MGKNLIYGVGINDADYVTEKREKILNDSGEFKWVVYWKCPYFSRWLSMLRRCYCTKELERKPTYKGCKVCEDWLTFSNFKSWMETQDWEGKALDKDILSTKGKIYSPSTCLFISHELNNFFLDNKSKRGLYPLGVTFDAARGKFLARCRNPFTKKAVNCGRYESKIEAFNAWKKKKLFFLDILKLEGKIDQTVYLVLLIKISSLTDKD